MVIRLSLESDVVNNFEKLHQVLLNLLVRLFQLAPSSSHIGNISQAIQSPARPEDMLTTGETTDVLLGIFRGYCLEFGAALAGWEAIREKAQEVSEVMLEAGQLTPL